MCSPETDAKGHAGDGALVSTLVVTVSKVCIYWQNSQKLLGRKRPPRLSTPTFDHPPPCQLGHSSKCHIQMSNHFLNT